VRFTSVLIAGFVFVLVTTVFSVSSPAQEGGLSKLLDIFESKGILTADEVRLIRQAAASDMQALQKKEQEIDLREQQLRDDEKKLTQTEKELHDEKHSESPTGEAASPKAASPNDGRTEPEGGRPAYRLSAGYDRGFCLQADNPADMSMCLGGLLQTDYRYYDYDEGDPENNRFDIRRARLKLSGSLLRYLGYKFEYEFQGTSSRNLLDAYADIKPLPAAILRLGQFKEPFGLEQYSPVANWFFNEPSFGYYLTPGRDVGGMIHGSVLDDRLNYGIGAFNGDGLDDSVGSDSDYPQVAGRLVLAPFRNRQLAVVENLQFGGSFSYFKIDRNNVDVQVETAGLTTFFDISPGAKFTVIQDADKLYQYGAELAWAVGPVALMSEYTWVRYKDIETSSNTLDLDLDAYYAALIWMVTGEQPTFRQGVIQPIVPKHSLGRGGWGAWGLGLRYDHFEAGNNVYGTLVEPGDSVRKADAYTVALNWYLNAFAQFMLDFTRTEFDRPLLIDRDSRTGEAVYSDFEDVFSARLQLSF
jgi:phosphate-selective porin OprO/OprP